MSTNGAFNIKNVTIQSAEYTADDDGYDKNGYKSVSSNAYFSAAAPKAFDIDPNTVPASGSVTQSVTATFDVSVVPSKFFKAAIEVDAPNGPREEPVEEP